MYLFKKSDSTKLALIAIGAIIIIISVLLEFFSFPYVTISGGILTIYSAIWFGVRGGFSISLFSCFIILIYYFVNPDQYILSNVITSFFFYLFLGVIVGLFHDRLKESQKQLIAAQISQRNVEKSLEEERNRFKQYLDIAGVMLLAVDSDGKVTYINQKGCDLLGCNFEDIIGENWFERFFPDVDDKNFINSDKFSELESYVLTYNQQKRLFHFRNTKLTDSEGNIEGILSSAEDITDRRQTENDLKGSEEKFRNLAENIPGVIYLCHYDKSYSMIYLNQDIESLTGYDKSDFLEGKLNLTDLILEKDLDTINKQVTRAIENQKPFYLIYRIKDVLGQIKWLEEKGIGVYKEGKLNHLEGHISDITARKEAEERIRFLSFYDELTGLYNRRFFNEELYRLDTVRQLPLSIILGDVNGLKLINDTFGHFEGDKLLLKAAEAFRESCRKEDVIARFGGDEFIVLLPKTTIEEANNIANRIEDNMKQKQLSHIPPSMSLGVATKDLAHISVHQLIKEAEDKMYEKKLLKSKQVRSDILQSLLKTLREKSYETERHSKRLEVLSVKIGEALNLPLSELQKLSILAKLHDIGKVTIARTILKKKTSLTTEEWKTIKKHPETGYKIALSAPEIAPIAECILYHHERWDGQGYPHGIEGDEIPLLSRIIAIVDSYDVMVSGRCYKKSMPKESAFKEIERCSGRQFDPNLARVFIDIMKEGTKLDTIS
ncbi:diguanylate cyclase [Natranaerobius trueperi]|uniref:Histidine kinase n=1 Tax=Natranaerobius trueperi TaxID=759412 RepID=A0A226C1B4_9FIRM|nr:HD domain-containing phosphohydrolase [Natranaerobius trueperi]OWZ84971.1 hypothetical protein CDO51_00775 [Natranaerobius trueperi]